MAGGAGERFWPLSRRNRPKQFLHLAEGRPTLLEETLRRLLLVVPPHDIYVVTGEHLRTQTSQLLGDVPAGNIIVEPAKRDTAGAIMWAMAHLDEDVTVGVFPADHAIEND